MFQLGQTRGAQTPNYRLHSPEMFVRATLPGMRGVTAIVHASPAGGAGFVQYTAEFESQGRLTAASDARFLYVIDGALRVGGDTLRAGDYACLPPADPLVIVALSPSRVAVIEKSYQVLPGTAVPSRLIGHEREVGATYLNDDPWLEVRPLVPDDPAFDFRVNTMTYQPGASLPAVEMHVMEHGLLMLEGGGIYRLGDEWHPVTAGDFIWMAPYCPQWFGAIGKGPAKYLIYKDWDRYPR